jgi:cation diffusion facilitator family transporter
VSKLLDWLGFGDEGYRSTLAGAHGGHGSHGGHGGHGHTHGVVDPTIATTSQGIWAIKWSFAILAVTAFLQVLVVIASGSVALLADTIHNVADATTAIPLWVAFRLVRRQPTSTFNFGYGKVEDLAGIVIVLIVFASALMAGYEALDKLVHPQPIRLLGWVVAAGLVGFIGNEAVAVFRIRVGRRINSAALVADGNHARVDGLTSLAVVLGAIGVWLGFPLADPIVGLLITLAIFGIVWQSATSVVRRMIDGVEPGMTAQASHAAGHVRGLLGPPDVKLRWLGHRLHLQATAEVDPGLTMAEADRVRTDLEAAFAVHLPALFAAHIALRPASLATRQAPASGPVPNHGHHHAPDPFVFVARLASGRLEIVGTAAGERMRLTLDDPVTGLAATVEILRDGGRVESLPLRAARTAGVFTSDHPPDEPHAFEARLVLSRQGRQEIVPFRMTEPGNPHK